MAQHTVVTGIKTLGVVSAIVLSFGLVAPSAFADDRSDRERGERKTIVLIGTHQPGTLGLATEIKEPSTTNGVGNQNLFSDDLHYKKNGELAGRNSAVCITTSPFTNPADLRPAHRGANLCTLAFVLLERGKITVSGIVTDEDFATGGFVLPIVGGTDEFLHAQGEYEVKFGVPTTLTFRLKWRTSSHRPLMPLIRHQGPVLVCTYQAAPPHPSSLFNLSLPQSRPVVKNKVSKL